MPFERLLCASKCLKFLLRLAGAEVLNLGCCCFKVSVRAPVRTLPSGCARPAKPGVVQHQMFHSILLLNSTKLKAFAARAAGKDVATGNFRHHVTEGCHSDQPHQQTLYLGLTNVKQVT